MLTCYIEGKNYVGNTSVEETFGIAEGAVFIENYNETLDSGTIILPQLDHAIDIEPFDIVVISGDNITTKRLCVDRFSKVQKCLDPAIYRYEIYLFSETKLLEGILCPSLAITRRMSGTPLTVGDYIERYVKLFGTKTEHSYDDVFVDKYTLDTTDANIIHMYSVECPEMQWNEPTLRELLNDLMMVCDCIPVVHNNVISCINVSQVGSEISNVKKKGINYITESQSSTDYVSEIKMHLQNAANNTRDIPVGQVAPDDATKIIERIGFRNDDSYLLDTTKMRVQTSFPIWNIYSLIIFGLIELKYKITESDGNTTATTSYDEIVEISRDLTPYVLEYGEWQTRDIYYDDWNIGYFDLNVDYRNRCLYFKRGGRNIENFCEYIEQQFLWIHDNKYVYEMIWTHDVLEDEADAYLQAKCDELHEQTGHTYTYQRTYRSPTVTWRNCQFQVEYDALDDCVFSASKSPLPTNKRIVADGQTNTFIDVNRQGFLEYLKANRLGNKIALVNGRYETNESTLPVLAEKINGKIIFQKQIAVHENYIDVNYQCTENYVLRDYYTGVKSKIRSWQLVDGSEALTRSEHIKYYINYNDVGGYSSRGMLIPAHQTLDEYLEDFQYCAIQFFDENDAPIVGNVDVRLTNSILYTMPTNAIMVEFTKHKVGNSVVFTIKMPDNAYDGNYISDWNGGSHTIFEELTEEHNVKQKGVRYTDENGECKHVIIYFFSAWEYYGMLGDGLHQGNVQANQCVRPYVAIGTVPGEPILQYENMHARDMVCKIPYTVYKDNKEILQFSIQFELNDEANDLFLGRK